MRGRKLLVGFVAAGSLAAGLAALPSPAVAQECTVTVTLVGGAHLSFTLNVPPGTPLSSLSLPVKLPILGLSESCLPDARTVSTATPTTPTTSSSAGSSPPAASTTPSLQQSSSAPG